MLKSCRFLGIEGENWIEGEEQIYQGYIPTVLSATAVIHSTYVCC